MNTDGIFLERIKFISFYAIFLLSNLNRFFFSRKASKTISLNTKFI